MEEVPEQWPVPPDHLARWAAVAMEARTLRYCLQEVVDPLPDSPLASDDNLYPWEKLSEWVRSFLTAAVDHLYLWANVVAPLAFVPGAVVANPPRPYFTIGRSSMESSAQAVWILQPDDGSERVHRHLRLHYHDLRYLEEALKASGDDRHKAVNRQRARIGERTSGRYSFGSIKKNEPGYEMMLREVGPLVGAEPDELAFLWKAASAAAHGKRWFSLHGFDVLRLAEYEPGHFRTLQVPRPDEITRTMAAAERLLQWGTLTFISRAGVDHHSVHGKNLSRVIRETPFRPGAEQVRDEALAALEGGPNMEDEMREDGVPDSFTEGSSGRSGKNSMTANRRVRDARGGGFGPPRD